MRPVDSLSNAGWSCQIWPQWAMMSVTSFHAETLRMALRVAPEIDVQDVC